MTNIYKVTNLINGHIYIGKTVNRIEDRWHDHVYSALSLIDKDRSCPFHSAIKKYGADNFKLELIESVNDEDGSAREIYWINYYDSYICGYNATRGGEGNTKYNHQEIYDLWQQGYTNMDICKQLGCDKGTVRKTLYTYGIDKSELFARRNGSLSSIDADEVLELWAEELTVTQIANFLGNSDKAISRILDKYGITSDMRKNRYYDSLLKVHWRIIMDLYDKGFTISQIRDKTQCNYTTIKRTIERHLVKTERSATAALADKLND